MATFIQTVLLGYDVVHAEVSYTMIECSFEEADTHDGENQNEERAHEKHIGHGRKRGKKSVDDKTHAFVSADDSERSQSS